MDLLLLGKVLWRKKWILILIPLMAAIAAYFLTMDAVEMYRSSSQISTGFTQNYEVSMSDEKFNIRDADVKFSNLLSSMNSALPVNLVSFRLLLHDLESEDPHRVPQHFYPTPGEVQQVKDFLKKKLNDLSPLSTSDPEYSLVRNFLFAYRYSYPEIKESVAIFRVLNTDNVQVDFLSDNPRISALGANAFAEEFIRYYNAQKSERTGESVEFLEQVMNQKKAAYDEKSETQKVFKASNGLVDINRDSEAKMAQLQELERQRDETRSRIQKLELTIQRLNDDIRSTGSTTTQQTVNNQRIIDLRNRIARMNERYITTGSSNKALLDSLESMREQLRIQMESVNQQAVSPPSTIANVADLKSRLKDAEIDLKVERTNLAQTDGKISNLRYAVSGFANKEAALETIQKEVELAQQEYLLAVNKYNEARNRMISSTTLRKVMAASPPPYPIASKKYLIIAAAGFSSFAICLFAIIGLELIDVSIKTPDKFNRIVNLPLVGMLNKIDSKNFNIRSYFNQATANEETEMYKSLLRKLRHEVENSGSKVILVTSPKRKDGKTFITFSLAYVLSLINKRVLIIDTNFKNNSLSQLLVKPNTEIKVLEGRRTSLLIGSGKEPRADGDTEGESTYDLINPTKYKNVFIVGNAGVGGESPAEILSGRNFRNLIDVLKESFDYILMEGAALNEFSDTKELVPFADTVFAVFSAESSIKQLDKESINYFRSLGKRFSGAILNRIKTNDLKL